MVSVLASALQLERARDRSAPSRPRSLVIAYALGVLLTFVVVALSAWRVSLLNIVAAVRGLPEPVARARRPAPRRRSASPGSRSASLLAWPGSTAPRRRRSRSGSRWRSSASSRWRARPACPSGSRYTVAGALLLGWWLLPFDVMSEIAGRELSMDFSAWVVSGLMLVAGATWLIVYNADVLLGAHDARRSAASARSRRC